MWRALANLSSLARSGDGIWKLIGDVGVALFRLVAGAPLRTVAPPLGL